MLSIWYSMCVGGEVNSAECMVYEFVWYGTVCVDGQVSQYMQTSHATTFLS